MKQKDWTERLRNRMADHEEPVRSDLWAAIEQAVDAGARPRKKAVVVAWRRWAAAAAAVVLVLGGATYVLLQHERQAGSIAGRIEKRTQPVVSEHETPVDPQGNGGGGTGRNLAVATVPALSVHPQGAEAQSVSLHQNGPMPSSDAEDTENAAHKNVPPQGGTAQTKPISRSVPKPVPHSEPMRRQGSRVSVNLYAANSMGNYRTLSGAMMSENLMSVYNISQPQNTVMYARREPVFMADTHEEVRHYRPISFGLTVNYALTDRISLSTGVVYTRMTSDFDKIVGSDCITKEQILHYVGVPLTVNYRLWGNKKLAVYAGAGGQADVNVAAKTVTDGGEQKMRKDHLQWSANAMMGVQYNILPQLGAYIEPGARYYFDNDSGIENFFKEKKLNFGLQMGIRFNVK